MESEASSNHKQINAGDELLTIRQAAELVGKTPSNISYLIQYGRLAKYDRHGHPATKARNGDLRVSRSELLNYFQAWNERIQKRMSQLSISDLSLAFLDVPERERTKHVHRLHPYLGKFIPHLVEYFLSHHFEPGQAVIDPFSGSGTTLVQAAEMGIHSVGIDISEFNVLIANVKLAKYDIPLMEREVLSCMHKTVGFSARAFDTRQTTLSDGKDQEVTDSEYLKTWFADQSLKEMFYYRNLITDYTYQDLLKVILSRTIRSCRLTTHYELAHPKKPVRGSYYCHKHNKICEPVTTIVPRLKYYSVDTIRRLKEFAALRKPVDSIVVEGNSQSIDLSHGLPEHWLPHHKVGGIFTSPPYVGQIDYHEQHRYAYELFGIKRRDELEVGPKSRGKGVGARKAYVEGISNVLVNLKRFIPDESRWFIVANDKLSLYPEIFERSGMRLQETFSRPVEDRTERDKRPYSENIFYVKPA
jgi:DNA methylase